MEIQAQIRVAGPEDLSGLIILYQQLNPNDPVLPMDEARDILERFMRMDGSAVFIAEKDGTVVSTCALAVIPNLTRGGRPYGLIENVVTHEAHRRRGHAAQVLKHAIEAAWESGCYKTMLLTGAKDPATLRFYQGVGFEQSKTGFQVRRLPAREA